MCVPKLVHANIKWITKTSKHWIRCESTQPAIVGLDILLYFDKPIVCTRVCLGYYQMKHQTCESPEIMHRSSVESPTKGPLIKKKSVL